MNPSFIRIRIANIEAQILELDAALLALSNGVVSYSINTGQSQQNVTRADVGNIQRTITGLENSLATLTARLTGGGVCRSVPQW